jgi:hypothetical protein
MDDSVDDPRDMYQEEEAGNGPFFTFGPGGDDFPRPAGVPGPFAALFQQLLAGQHTAAPQAEGERRDDHEENEEDARRRDGFAMTLSFGATGDGGSPRWRTTNVRHFGYEGQPRTTEPSQGDGANDAEPQNRRRQVAGNLATFLGQAFGPPPPPLPQSPSDGRSPDSPAQRAQLEGDPLAQGIFRLLGGLGGDGGVQFFFGPEFGGTGQAGDYVFTQQGLDNVITQLMVSIPCDN